MPGSFQGSLVGNYMSRKMEVLTGRYVQRRPVVEERTAAGVRRLRHGWVRTRPGRAGEAWRSGCAGLLEHGRADRHLVWQGRRGLVAALDCRNCRCVLILTRAGQACAVVCT